MNSFLNVPGHPMGPDGELWMGWEGKMGCSLALET